MIKFKNTHLWHTPPFSVRALNAALLAISVITVIAPLITIAYFLIEKS